MELLDPRKVAARKIARAIAERSIPEHALPAKGKRATRRAEGTAVVEEVPASRPYDPLERLLDAELRKYGVTLG